MTSHPLRIAFLTPEFPTEPLKGGGLASYLGRITRALQAHGHSAEVFVVSKFEPGVVDYHGIPVHRVRSAHDDARLRIARAGLRGLRLRGTLPLVQALAGPLALAWALHRREREEPFDLVQSADYRASGLFVHASAHRRHVVRCSSAVDLFTEADGTVGVAKERWRSWLELRSIRRADGAYAPSALVADHYRERLGMHLPVVRPPVVRESDAAEGVPWELPARYFIHFGRLIHRKGTRWLAGALPRVWEQEPEFRMVFAGPQAPEFEEWASAWNEHRSKVTILPAISKAELYHVLQRAEVAVLPSIVDNLPNTVIESLMFGVPVIGSAGASIDELVENGRTGTLVPIGDSEALAQAMVRHWRGEAGMSKGFQWCSDTRALMEPDRAVAALLEMAAVLRPGTRRAPRA